MISIKNKKTFSANGVEYKVLSVESALTPERYYAYEYLRFAYAYDSSLEVVGNRIEEAEKIINGIVTGVDRKRNILHATTILYGLIETLRKPTAVSQTRGGYMMMLCTLFIIKEGEDLAKWNEADAQAKVDDWTAEGINILDFFTLGIDAVRQFSAALMQITENG